MVSGKHAPHLRHAIGPVRASAQFDQESFYVRQPEVEKGETEIEEHGAFFSGPTTEESLGQSHETLLV